MLSFLVKVSHRRTCSHLWGVPVGAKPRPQLLICCSWGLHCSGALNPVVPVLKPGLSVTSVFSSRWSESSGRTDGAPSLWRRRSLLSCSSLSLVSEETSWVSTSRSVAFLSVNLQKRSNKRVIRGSSCGCATHSTHTFMKSDPTRL